MVHIQHSLDICTSRLTRPKVNLSLPSFLKIRIFSEWSCHLQVRRSPLTLSSPLLLKANQILSIAPPHSSVHLFIIYLDHGINVLISLHSVLSPSNPFFTQLSRVDNCPHFLTPFLSSSHSTIGACLLLPPSALPCLRLHTLQR